MKKKIREKVMKLPFSFKKRDLYNIKMYGMYEINLN